MITQEDLRELRNAVSSFYYDLQLHFNTGEVSVNELERLRNSLIFAKLTDIYDDIESLINKCPTTEER